MLASLIAIVASRSNAAPSSTSVYNWIYVLVGLIMLVGFVYAGIRWLKKQAVAEAALQKLVDANVLDRLKDQDDVLAEIRRAQAPNGLDTDAIGDITKRTEMAVERIEAKQDALATKVDATNTKLDQHIGEERAERSQIWRAIREGVSAK